MTRAHAPRVGAALHGDTAVDCLSARVNPLIGADACLPWLQIGMFSYTGMTPAQVWSGCSNGFRTLPCKPCLLGIPCC